MVHKYWTPTEFKRKIFRNKGKEVYTTKQY